MSDFSTLPGTVVPQVFFVAPGSQYVRVRNGGYYIVTPTNGGGIVRGLRG
jgi:hypothetical protein